MSNPVKKYRNVKSMWEKQKNHVDGLNHLDFFRKYLTDMLATVPDSPDRLGIVRPVSKDIKETKYFTIHKYNKIASEINYILKHKARKTPITRKRKGIVYIVKVQLYRVVNEGEEKKAKYPIKFVNVKDSEGNDVKCRVGCTINFQVQTKDDLKPYEDKIIPVHENDTYENLNEILTQNPEYKAKLAQCESWIVAMKMAVLETLESATQIDLSDFHAYKSMNGPLPKICNDYTAYKGETLKDVINSDVLTKYLMSSFKEHACFYTAIINAYPSLKLRIGSTRGSAEMNYDNLKKYFISKGVKVSDDFGLTVNQALVFFKDYKINFTAINIKNQVITEHKEENRNTNLSKTNFECMIHNSHIYTLNNQLKAVKNGEGELKVSQNYRLHQMNSFDCVIDTTEELLNLKIPSDVKYCILYTGDMDDLLLHMINILKYEP
jgi:hypothetical protein